MGIKERKAREREALRQSILDAAMALFREGGYEHVTVRKIADRIEYSPATLYLIFRDKNEIFYQLREEGFRRLLQYQSESQQIDDPLQRFHALGEKYLQFAMEEPEYYEIVFILNAPMERHHESEASPDGTPWEDTYGMRSFGLLRDSLVQLMEAGLIHEGHPEAAALYIWANVHGMASLYLRDRMSFMTPEAQKHAMQEAMNYGLRILQKPK